MRQREGRHTDRETDGHYGGPASNESETMSQHCVGLQQSAVYCVADNDF